MFSDLRTFTIFTMANYSYVCWNSLLSQVCTDFNNFLTFILWRKFCWLFVWLGCEAWSLFIKRFPESCCHTVKQSFSLSTRLAPRDGSLKAVFRSSFIIGLWIPRIRVFSTSVVRKCNDWTGTCTSTKTWARHAGEWVALGWAGTYNGHLWMNWYN